MNSSCGGSGSGATGHKRGRSPGLQEEGARDEPVSQAPHRDNSWWLKSVNEGRVPQSDLSRSDGSDVTIRHLKFGQHEGSFVFDRQYRPHVVCTVNSLRHPREVRRKYDLFDLSPQTRLSILKELCQTAELLFKSHGGHDAIAFHCGKWADSWHFHCHIIAPLSGYFRLRESHFKHMQKRPDWESWDIYVRGWDAYRRSTLLKQAKYGLEDESLAKLRVKQIGDVSPSVDVAGLERNSRVNIRVDPGKKYASVVSFTAKDGEVLEVGELLEDALSLAQRMGFDRASHIFVMPCGNEIRIFVPIENFVCIVGSNRAEREEWLNGWASSDGPTPNERATPGLNLSLCLEHEKN